MKVHLLGVRGSTPVSGPEYLRYGGHTSCVAIVPAGSDTPTILLDAGTGLQLLGELIPDAPFAGTILCTHLHWDHIQGLPFAKALDRADSSVHIVIPSADGVAPDELVAGLMRPPYFPITPHGLAGTWTFAGIPPALSEPVEFVAGDATVRALDIEHKGGRTLAYRIDLDGASIGYAPDHALATEPSQAVVELFRGVDVLLHDAQFTEAESAISATFGHSTIEQAMALANRCDVGLLVLTHHSPARTDDQLDAIGAKVSNLGQPVAVARGGDVIDVVGVRAAS